MAGGGGSSRRYPLIFLTADFCWLSLLESFFFARGQIYGKNNDGLSVINCEQ
jgi:hypothetical protein